MEKYQFEDEKYLNTNEEEYEELPTEKARFRYLDTEEEVKRLLNSYWGHAHYVITDEEIEALKQGKFLVDDNGEYSISIIYEASNH